MSVDQNHRSPVSVMLSSISAKNISTDFLDETVSVSATVEVEYKLK
jgi:hypothetical protein